MKMEKSRFIPSIFSKGGNLNGFFFFNIKLEKQAQRVEKVFALKKEAPYLWAVTNLSLKLL